jgi:hypothetical protein
MNITLLPKTTLGKWSTGLIIAAFLMLVVFIIEVVLESRGGVTFDWNGIWPAIPIILAVVFAISSMVIGIIGIVKSKERSILVFIATALGVLGVFALLIAVGELLVPQ